MRFSSAIIILGALCTSNALLTIKNNDCMTFTKTLSLPENTTITNAFHHQPHTVNITSGTQDIYNKHAFCEVNGLVYYGTNSSLHFSVYLPDASSYNGRFMAVGNGGMAGTLDSLALLQQLNSGFASAAGDAGHLAALNNAGSGAPDTYLPYLHDADEVQAWIHNAISLFVPASKQLIHAYYDKPAAYSYYTGCSTGGAQGFALAQYHPELFDGIIAGCPGNWYSHLALSFLWNGQHAMPNTSSYLSQEVLNFTSNAVLKACDEKDGVKDGVIENPLACNFSIDTLACSTSAPGNESDVSCLTLPQITAAKAIYSGPKNAKTGKQLYPGFSHGSEIQWILQEGDLADAFSIPILQNLVYDDLSYNASTFNWSTDVATLDMNAGAKIDAISTNLTAFRNRGGKLLVYQGWADPFNAQTWPIQHYEDVSSFFNNSDISDFYNVFMVPGGGHCGAASFYPQVPAVYHTVPALMEWVERGQRPRQVLSTEPSDGEKRSRKLCAWPRVAVYVQGDVEDWTSYVCE